jgi:hypothetical protein
MKPGWKNSVSTFAACLVWYAIAYGLLSLVLPSNLQFQFLPGAELVATVYWSSFLAAGVWRLYAAWRESWSACEHGVRGGRRRRLSGRCEEIDSQNPKLVPHARPLSLQERRFVAIRN